MYSVNKYKSLSIILRPARSAGLIWFCRGSARRPFWRISAPRLARKLQKYAFESLQKVMNNAKNRFEKFWKLTSKIAKLGLLKIVHLFFFSPQEMPKDGAILGGKWKAGVVNSAFPWSGARFGKDRFRFSPCFTQKRKKILRFLFSFFFGRT